LLIIYIKGIKKDYLEARLHSVEQLDKEIELGCLLPWIIAGLSGALLQPT
jgi:hypothetical protein